MPTLEKTSYGWGLPSIDTTADGADGEIYRALQQNCDEGDKALTEKWQSSSSPRNVLLFGAGVQACRGDMNKALVFYNRAEDEYGWGGLGPAQSDARCDVYKSVASALEKAPRDRFPCPDGPNPDFRRSTSGVVDNPLTPEDERVAATDPTTGVEQDAGAANAPTQRSTSGTRTDTSKSKSRTATAGTGRSTGSGAGSVTRGSAGTTGGTATGKATGRAASTNKGSSTSGGAGEGQKSSSKAASTKTGGSKTDGKSDDGKSDDGKKSGDKKTGDKKAGNDNTGMENSDSMGEDPKVGPMTTTGDGAASSDEDKKEEG